MYSYFRRALYNNDDFEVSFSCSRTKTRSLRVTRRVLCGWEHIDASYIYIPFLRKNINQLSLIQLFLQKCHFAKRYVYGFLKISKEHKEDKFYETTTERDLYLGALPAVDHYIHYVEN